MKLRRGSHTWLEALRLTAAAALLSTSVLAGAVPQAAAGEPGDMSFLRVSIDRVTPELVTTTTDSSVTVSGTITNVGDRAVKNVVVRLEHDEEVTSSSGLRTALAGSTDSFRAVAPFISIAPKLDRGQARPFVLSYPVRSAKAPSLSIDKPGVYPLLVNVNGTPDYGEPARLDDARFLLPVLGVPPDPSDDVADVVAGVVPPDTSRPVQVTMVWPLADRPRLAPGVTGGANPVRLSDDELAVSLTTGGRLETLLAAAEFATNPQVDPAGRVRTAMCLAVDPDLLVTVNAMTSGYVVADNPTDRNSTVHPGTGQAAAASWLDRLRKLATRLCVLSTPYAQADLDALSRVGDPGLAAIAVNGAGDIVDQLLGIRSLRGTAVLGDDPLTKPAADLLAAQGTRVVLAAAACAAENGDGDKPPTADVSPQRVSAQLVVAPFDSAVGAALAAAGATPSAPTYLDRSLSVASGQDSATARRQDAVAAMLWPALNPAVEPRTQILVPPLNWDLQTADAQEILTTLATSINAGLATPRSLPAVMADAQANAGPAAGPLPAQDRAGRFDDRVISDIRRDIGPLWGLTASLTVDPRTGLTGTQYTAPLREDMLRALSQAEPPAARNGLAVQRLAVVDATISAMFKAVTIVNPGGNYTLATERSPLPLVLRNELPVPVRVRLQVAAPPGMTVSDMGIIELPPGYLPLRVPIEVHFTQRVAVDVALTTQDGLALGEPVRLSVHSNAYGKVLFAITISAGAVLVLLAGRRLWHRFRGQPDRADLDRPEPLDRPELM